MSDEKNLRENLFSAEPVSPDRQQRFREELAQILEPRLPRSHRLYYQTGLVCLAIGIPGAACGFLFDSAHRWIWGLNLLVLIACAGWTIHVLRRGAEPLRAMQDMSKALAGIAGIFAGYVIFHGLQSPSLANVLWALLGLLMFLFTSFINLWNRVITAERTTREHVLRVEHRLADLSSRPPTPR
ncbi:MAG: hypothetical protein M3O30_19540 [Planctomycetota bacterium]|nr:hypothetical protein [Planctomycetota bacterium]